MEFAIPLFVPKVQKSFLLNPAFLPPHIKDVLTGRQLPFTTFSRRCLQSACPIHLGSVDRGFLCFADGRSSASLTCAANLDLWVGQSRQSDEKDFCEVSTKSIRHKINQAKIQSSINPITPTCFHSIVLAITILPFQQYRPI